MSEKVYDVASDDLADVSFSLEKIRAIAISARSYLDNSFLDSIFEADETTKHFIKNQVRCMFGVIEDLTNATNNQLSATIEKLCAICRETGVSV